MKSSKPAKKHSEKVCENPSCRKAFTPGNYGKRQHVCGRDYVADCRKCPGKDCKKCGGKGSYKSSCRVWYKHAQLSSAPPPRGLGEIWEKVSANLSALPLRHEALVRVARATGLRKGELLGLSWGDVLDDAGKIREGVTLRGKWDDDEGFGPTKTDRVRRAFLSADARASLAKLLVATGKEQIEKKQGPVRPTQRIWKMTCSWAWKRWVLFQASIGVVNPATGYEFRFHDLRHTLGCDIAQKTGDLAMVAQVLGHQSLESSKKYVTRTDAEVTDALDKIQKKGAKKK